VPIGGSSGLARDTQTPRHKMVRIRNIKTAVLESLGWSRSVSPVTTFSEVIDRYLSGQGAERFSLPALHGLLMGTRTWESSISSLFSLNLDATSLTSLQRGLIRWAFLAQVVEEPAINTTRYRARWSARLEGDPRRASPEVAEAFFNKSIEIICENFANAESKRILTGLLGQTLVPAELPLDYLSKTATPIHVSTNIKAIDIDLLETTLILRSLFKNNSNEVTNVMKKVYDKVQVKSYLTDRVLTGSHKTNREYRWEVSPKSVHFAFKRDCMEIENSLVLAVINMDGFPPALRSSLTNSAGIKLPVDHTACPITLEKLSFDKLSNELLNPNHGKSSFQVGHLDPLKNDGTHIADNIAWVSDEGNRIQGDNTLDQTRSLLMRIFDAYKRARII
jgi:hypothetical protein